MRDRERAGDIARGGRGAGFRWWGGEGSRAGLLLCLALLPALQGCTRDYKFQAISMWNESRLKPMEPAPAAAEASSARELVQGTVPRGGLRTDEGLYSGRRAGTLVATSPIPITREVLARGQSQFTVFCAPCHGAAGDGTGMIVKRGFPPPPDYAIARLRSAPLGHFYDVITNGYGVMYSYASRVAPKDRWAIAAYIRVLQKTRPEVPEDIRPLTRPNPTGSPPTGAAGA